VTRNTPDAPEPDPAVPTDPTDPGQVGEVLEQVRGEAIRLLEEVPQPRALRMQAGGVSVDVEWATAGQQAHPVAPAGDGPAEPAAEAAEPAAEPDGPHVTAPAVGVFYRAPEPGADPFVAEGDTVSAGQQVAIVEAMKLMIPVEADQPGRIVTVLKDNGEPVEYGERLFALEPGDVA
jgi:acetyl-CoA carboxylase biotin carboxyl carrier protein